MSTVALTTDNEVLVCGLNNYSQVTFTQIITPYVYSNSSFPEFSIQI